MAGDAREPMNFRLGRTYREALHQLAREQDKAVGQLVREVVEEYVTNQARAAWEAEARRTAAQLGEAARDPASGEAEMVRILGANLDEFSREWVWNEDGK